MIIDKWLSGLDQKDIFISIPYVERSKRVSGQSNPAN